jgi:protein required for attachment to host cells
MFNQTSFHGKTANGVDIDQTYGMPERKSWRTVFVVANRGIAHILEQRDRTSSPHLLCSIYNEQERRSEVSAASRQRPTIKVSAEGSSKYEHAIVANASVEDFCRIILKKLHRIGDNSDGIVLVASPQVLGTLRQQLKKQSLGLEPVTDYAKDLASMPAKHLRRRLQTLVKA